MNGRGPARDEPIFSRLSSGSNSRWTNFHGRLDEVSRVATENQNGGGQAITGSNQQPSVIYVRSANENGMQNGPKISPFVTSYIKAGTRYQGKYMGACLLSPQCGVLIKQIYGRTVNRFKILMQNHLF